MIFFRNSTQTLIGSLSKVSRWLAILTLFTIYFLPSTIYAASPQDLSNNKVGIHIISATPDEIDRASQLVNSSGGDWGYVTITMEDGDRKKDKWQSFFDKLRRKHLIPLIRLATHLQGSSWQLPGSQESQLWADFLNSLNWPTKNRYVIVYNEPNQGQEWGGSVSPSQYAMVLDQAIAAFKSRSTDFYILNAGFDQQAPENLPGYEDEEEFLRIMNQTDPGIFNKLDGWASHSYPNPGYVGSPTGFGRGSVKGYQWELSVLQNLGLIKQLPVFITETGWKHAEGLSFDKSLPLSAAVGKNLQVAFQNAWSDTKILAITPFLLDYQTAPFDHFSFRKLEGDIQNLKVLGTQLPDISSFYPQFASLVDLPKVAGTPLQDQTGKTVAGGVPTSLVEGESYNFTLTLENTGQSIWGEKAPLKLAPLSGLPLEVSPAFSNQVEPGKRATFQIKMRAPAEGSYSVSFGLFNGVNQVAVTGLNYQISVKSPVILVIRSSLKWRGHFSGSYILGVISSLGESMRSVVLGDRGISDKIEARDLLPDYQFNFTLKKPYYQGKTVHQQVHSGVNTLDFGELQPDIGSALLNPPELWKLLPFSN